ncbi:MAG: type II secretion system minor pseudopilin GspJ [Hyphomonas sp.]
MRQDGFSLIEVLVALSISAVIGLSGVTVLHQTLQASERVQSLTDRNAELQSAHRLLGDDFADATNDPVRSGPGSAVEAGFLGAAPGSSFVLRLTRKGWTNPALLEERGDALRVELFVRDHALVRRAWLRPDATDLTPHADRKILSDVEQVTPRFLARGDWFSAWGPDRPGLPDAIELSIRFRNGQVLRLVYAVVGGA